jgi:multiple sugar transport system substrate-binding protein
MFALTACATGTASKDAGQSGTDTGKNAPAQQSAADLAKKAAEEPTELVFYVTNNGWTEDKFMESYGDPIRKKFPKYTIKFYPQKDGKTFEQAIATNQTIDILISSVGLTPAFLLTYNVQSDISDLIKKYNYDLNRLEPSTVEIQRQLANGGIYGLPVTTSSAALFYNKDLFDKFGVSYPKDGMNWDELYELAQKMTRNDGGQQYKGFTNAFQHLMFLNQLSAPHLDSKTFKALYTADNFKRAFENYARFYKIPGNDLPKNKFTLGGQQDPFYKDQTVAMFMTLSGAGKTYQNLLNWDVVQVPFFKDKPGVGAQSYPNYFYITSTSKHRDAAFQVLAYATSDEYQEWLMKDGVPSVLKDQSKLISSFGINEPFYKGKNIKSLLPAKFAAPTMKTQYQAIADKETLAALGEYTSGKDVNTVLREAAERTDKEIAAQLGK